MRDARIPSGHAMRRFCTLAATAITLLAGSSGAASATPPDTTVPIGPTVTAAVFQDSLGICVHWEQKDGAYGQVAAVQAALRRLGFHHIRGFDPVASPPLAAQGIRATLVAGPEMGSPAAIRTTVEEANRDGTVIDAVEGPNEPDLFWPMHGYSYDGQGFPAGVIAYQRDLYDTLKASPHTAKIQIIGPSLGRTYDPGGGFPNPFPRGILAGAVDLGNFHPYPFGGNSFSTPFPYDGIKRYPWTGNIPSGNLDEFPYAWNVYAPPFAPKPMAATETGYPTWRNGVSEDVQARYLPRLLAEYLRLGIRRAYLYELIDSQPDPTGAEMEDHFGLLHNDLSPKPAFIALASLAGFLAANAAPRAEGPPPGLVLRAQLPPGFDRTDFVHSLLLRLSDTRSALLAWHEIADADTATTPPRMIAVSAGRLAVTIAAPYRAEAWLDYGTDWRLHSHPVTGPSVTLPLEDRITILLLRRPAGAAG